MLCCNIWLLAQCTQDNEQLLLKNKSKLLLDNYLKEKMSSFNHESRELGFGFSQYVYRIICDQDTRTTLGLSLVVNGDDIIAASRLPFRYFNALETYLIDTTATQRFITSHNTQYHTSFSIQDFMKYFSNLDYFAIRCTSKAHHDITPKACAVIEETSEQKIRELLRHINPESQIYGLLGMFWHGYEFSSKEKALVDNLLKQNFLYYQCHYCRVSTLGFSHILERILRYTNNTWKGQDRFDCITAECKDPLCIIEE